MNNKSDKKHKPKPKPKNKKKSTSRLGGAPWSLTGLFSKKTPPTTELQPQLLSNSESSSLPNSKKTSNLNNRRSNLSQNVPPPPQPNAQPQGFNTIKSTSRCSIQ